MRGFKDPVVILAMLTFVVSLVVQLNASLDWLSIGKTKDVNFTSTKFCARFIGWSSSQKRFCRRHIDYVDAIKEAAKLTISECQLQFKARRWNCSTKRLPHIFGKLPLTGFREASYLQALSSAALTYSVTSACSEGRLRGCSCDESKNGYATEGYIWSGCSDNIAYGMAVAEKFLDPRIREKLSLTLTNKFNQEAGRQIIEQNMVKQCKCHGVSGSCELKTCWRAMPPFSLVAAKLKERYDAAVQVKAKRGEYKYRLVPRHASYQKLSPTDLVFTQPSPDYCLPVPAVGAHGVRGRVCNRTSRGIDGCRQLCCGRPYTTRLELVTYKCNCTFVWCCSLKCNECTKLVQVTKCR